MAFVKLDCGMLESSIWVDRDQRSLFVTALLMAQPYELKEATPQLEVRSLEPTGWMVPAGWYGIIAAAGIGIVRRDGMERETGIAALEVLSAPDPESRSEEFDGRRIARVNGGYVVLNFMKYRDHDHTAAERQRRLRERRKVTRDGVDVTRDVTLQLHIAEGRGQRAEAKADTDTTTPTTKPPKRDGLPPFDALFEEAWALYPKRPGNGKQAAWRQWLARVAEGVDPVTMLAGTRSYAEHCQRDAVEPLRTKMGQTFYGRDRHFESDFSSATARQSPRPAPPGLSARAFAVAMEATKDL